MRRVGSCHENRRTVPVSHLDAPDPIRAHVVEAEPPYPSCPGRSVHADDIVESVRSSLVAIGTISEQDARDVHKQIGCSARTRGTLACSRFGFGLSGRSQLPWNVWPTTTVKIAPLTHCEISGSFTSAERRGSPPSAPGRAALSHDRRTWVRSSRTAARSPESVRRSRPRSRARD
jgi:hypothetical protein